MPLGTVANAILHVVPRMGAWIEIAKSWKASSPFEVVPRMGAWIEMIEAGRKTDREFVVPRMGAWIEIEMRGVCSITFRRSPHGGVD